MSGHVLHLLALAVALNLGVGALIFFAEPVRGRILRHLWKFELQYISAMENDSIHSHEDTNLLFLIGVKYLNVRKIYDDLNRDLVILYSPFVRSTVLGAALFSISFMIVLVFIGEVHLPLWITTISAFLVLIPVCIAIVYYVVSIRLDTRLSPEIDTLKILHAGLGRRRLSTEAQS